MGYQVLRSDGHAYEERPNREGEPPRLVADVTTAAGLQQSRARLWRCPAHTRGRRHIDLVQEEVFVVLRGTLTMLLGDPPERVDLPPESVVSVQPRTTLQLRNETEEEVVVFAYGAPPEAGKGEFLPDVEL